MGGIFLGKITPQRDPFCFDFYTMARCLRSPRGKTQCTFLLKHPPEIRNPTEENKHHSPREVFGPSGWPERRSKPTFLAPPGRFSKNMEKSVFGTQS